MVIVDDELLARQRIEDLLAKREEAEIVAVASDGPSAVEAIEREQPDILFLDVQMPGISGIDVAKRIGEEKLPVTIFVTAFDHHAVEAFELAAIDYLVKPFDDERFDQAFRRAVRAVEVRHAGVGSTSEQPREYQQVIAVELRGQVRALPVARVEYITASGAYAELHVGERTFVVRERMQALAERLDPSKFIRIHRSAIVRLDFIDVFLRSAGGDYAVRLKNGVELSVSRSRREELEEKMGIA